MTKFGNAKTGNKKSFPNKFGFQKNASSKNHNFPKTHDTKNLQKTSPKTRAIQNFLPIPLNKSSPPKQIPLHSNVSFQNGGHLHLKSASILVRK
jgi:hypothetical protein